MNRNRNDYFAGVPTPSLPRSKQNFGVHSRTITAKHGVLTPWYCRLVYPDSNLKIDMNAFVRADTSLKVPLQDIFMDNYFFFVPLRIIDPNFAKILGDKTFYDTNTYNFPQLALDGAMDKDCLLQYLGYGAATDSGTGSLSTDVYWNHAGGLDYYNATPDSGIGYEYINPYSLAAYYKIWNEFFRDNNLDTEIPIDDLLVQGTPVSQATLQTISVWKGLKCLPVNRTHDIFSGGLITPINDGAQGEVTIPMGQGLVPVITTATDVVTGAQTQLRVRETSSGSAQSLYSGRLLGTDYNGGSVGLGVKGASATGQSFGSYSYYPSNLAIDASKATGPSVQQLYVAMALYSLYDKRGTFGSRLIEQIRGQFGLEIPDGLVDRAEYLGGSNQTLNNIPVLDTTGSALGAMRGNSATLTGLNSFDKFFNEWGFVIGVSCFRVKHIYGQGIMEPSLKMFDSLDMYWPSFANIGKVGTPNYRIFNNHKKAKNTEIFNYNEPWIDQHTEIDYCAGEFGAFHSASSFTTFTQWSYQDIYSDFPVFSPTWLKEPIENIQRTMTGQLLPDSTGDGHQYMIQYAFKTELTMPIPTHSKAPNITGRI